MAGLVTGDADHLALAVKCFEEGPRPLALASALSAEQSGGYVPIDDATVTIDPGTNMIGLWPLVDVP